MDQGQAISNCANSWLLLSEAGSHVSHCSELGMLSLRDTYRNTVAGMPNNLAQTDVQVFDSIERDVLRTFAGSSDDTADKDRLRRLLAVLAIVDREVGYCQGLNFLAAFMLKELPEADAFGLLCRLLYGPMYRMRGLYLHGLPDVAIHTSALQELLAACLPEVHSHLERVGVDLHFVFDWYFTLGIMILPPDMAKDVVRAFLADGWPALYAIVLALLEHLWPQLRTRQESFEVITLFKGYANAQVAANYPELDLNATDGMEGHSHAGAGGTGSEPTLQARLQELGGLLHGLANAAVVNAATRAAAAAEHAATWVETASGSPNAAWAGPNRVVVPLQPPPVAPGGLDASGSPGGSDTPSPSSDSSRAPARPSLDMASVSSQAKAVVTALRDGAARSREIAASAADARAAGAAGGGSGGSWVDVRGVLRAGAVGGQVSAATDGAGPASGSVQGPAGRGRGPEPMVCVQPPRDLLARARRFQAMPQLTVTAIERATRRAREASGAEPEDIWPPFAGKPQG